MDQINNLKIVALNEDREIALEALTEMTRLGGEEVFQFYVHLLNSEKPFLRNGAASGLMQLADPRAVPFLLEAIRNPANYGRNGTLVYALSAFDCHHLFRELWLIILYQGYEAKLMALNILDEQSVTWLHEDADEVRRHWLQVRQQPDQAMRDIGLDFLRETIEAL